jgi:hypothetical protein
VKLSTDVASSCQRLRSGSADMTLDMRSWSLQVHKGGASSQPVSCPPPSLTTHSRSGGET